MPLIPNSHIEIVDYTSEWKEEFNQLQTVLSEKLSKSLKIIEIEHIGSTSIEGLASKPIIDLVIVIEDNNQLEKVEKLLNELEYSSEGDKGIKDRYAFKRKDKYTPNIKTGKEWVDHHLYVCAKDCEEYKKQIAFRDYLKKYKEIANLYEQLKKKLAIEYKNDRVKYTDGKTDFIESILEKAKKEKTN